MITWIKTSNASLSAPGVAYRNAHWPANIFYRPITRLGADNVFLHLPLILFTRGWEPPLRSWKMGRAGHTTTPSGCTPPPVDMHSCHCTRPVCENSTNFHSSHTFVKNDNSVINNARFKTIGYYYFGSKLWFGNMNMPSSSTKCMVPQKSWQLGRSAVWILSIVLYRLHATWAFLFLHSRIYHVNWKLISL